MTKDEGLTLSPQSCEYIKYLMEQRSKEPKRSEIFCGVDYTAGILSVSVMRQRPNGVSEVLHSEQIEVAQPKQQPLTEDQVGSFYQAVRSRSQHKDET
jgi:hypothetical protein